MYTFQENFGDCLNCSLASNFNEIRFYIERKRDILFDWFTTSIGRCFTSTEKPSVAIIIYDFMRQPSFDAFNKFLMFETRSLRRVYNRSNLFTRVMRCHRICIFRWRKKTFPLLLNYRKNYEVRRCGDQEILSLILMRLWCFYG